MSTSVRGWLKQSQIRRRNEGVNVKAEESRVSSRLIEVVSSLPSSRLIKPFYIWPCFNCQTDVTISRNTFLQLESRTLLGIKCHDCLSPKGDTLMLVA